MGESKKSNAYFWASYGLSCLVIIMSYVVMRFNHSPDILVACMLAYAFFLRSAVRLSDWANQPSTNFIMMLVKIIGGWSIFLIYPITEVIPAEDISSGYWTFDRLRSETKARVSCFFLVMVILGLKFFLQIPDTKFMYSMALMSTFVIGTIGVLLWLWAKKIRKPNVKIVVNDQTEIKQD